MLSMRPLLFFLLLSLLLSSTSASTRYEEDELTGHVASTREEILSTRQLRKKQFGDMLAGHQAQLDAHNSGEQLLTEKDYNRVNQKVKSYTHKLKELDLDEDPRFVDRLIAREAHLNEVTRTRILRRSAEL